MRVLGIVWAKPLRKLVIGVLVAAAIVLTCLEIFSMGITLDLKPIPIPSNRLLQAFVAAADHATVEGSATLRSGTHTIDGVKVKVAGNTVVVVAGVLLPNRPSQSETYRVEVKTGEATVKSGTIEMEIGGVLVDFKSIVAKKNGDLAATVKFRLLKSLAATLSEDAMIAPSGPHAASLRKLLKEVKVNSLGFVFRDAAKLPLPSGGSVLLQRESVATLQNLAWQADGSLSGTAAVDLKLGPGTAVPLNDGMLYLTTAELKASGKYTRRDGTETVVISTNSADATSVPHISLAGAKIEVNSKALALIENADAAISRLAWTRSDGKDNIELVARVQGQMGLPVLPVPGGTLSVRALTLQGTDVKVLLGGSAPKMSAEIGSAKADGWALKFKEGKSEYAVDGSHALFTNVNVASFNGTEIAVPAASVKLTRLAMNGEGASVSMSFDPKSNVSLSGGELRAQVLSAVGRTPTLGSGAFKGKMQSISVNAGGFPFTLSNVDADLEFDLATLHRIRGQVSFVGDAIGVRDNIIAKLGPPSGFNVAALHVTSISADVGQIGGRLRFDILSDRKGTAAVDVSAANCSVTATGTGCGGSLNLVATVPQLAATVDVASRQVAVETLINLDSRSEVCAWTKGQRVALATVRAWAKVQPFKVGVKAKMRTQLEESGRIVVTIDSLSPNDPNEYIRVKVPVRHLPDAHDVIIRPFDTPQLAIGFPLGFTLHQPNPIRAAIQNLVGKSFVVKD